MPVVGWQVVWLAWAVGCDGRLPEPVEPAGPVAPAPLQGAEAARALVDSLDARRYAAAVETLAGFGDRTQGSESHARAEAWVVGQLEGMGYAVERHAYAYEGEPRESLYATREGAAHPERMVIVSAHLDGTGGGGAADDDASGVAVVLEAARAFAAQGVVPGSSVRFVLWNNEETGLDGAKAYAAERAPLQGVEDPPGSGRYPEPAWMGVIQHDMLLFDHGLPPGEEQVAGADIDVEFAAGSAHADGARALAEALRGAATRHEAGYPAEVGGAMSHTDSVPFQELCPAVSVRENERLAEIGQGANPHWHQGTDVFSTYTEADLALGFAAARMTVGAVAELVEAEVLDGGASPGGR